MNTKIEELKKFKIGVFAGGISSEREISLKSGKAVFDALNKSDLDVVFIDIDNDNVSSLIDKNNLDAVFIALHGRFGEDGTIQAILEGKGVAYTGSNPDSSRLAIDKINSKEKFKARGLNVPDYHVVSSSENINDAYNFLPCVVKPRFEGSSIGLTVVKNREDLQKALDIAASFSEDIIVERFIQGREITVGILEEDTLPVVEILTPEGVYDFEAKYISDKTRYIVPALLTENQSKLAQETALEAHKSLGCSGFSRVDMILDEEDKIFVLEVNTIPGLTERSLLPMAAKAANIDFRELCIRMLHGTIESAATKQSRFH